MDIEELRYTFSMSTKILEGLNPKQAQAVSHKDGPLLIIAGAGTGKTTVITRRIAWLIEQKLSSTDEILALTFTDKAASSMQEKVDILVPYGYLDIWISTFHAFGDRLLRENALELGLNPDFKVLTRPEAAVFFREHIFEFDLSYYRPLSDPTRFIEALLDIFSRLKDEDISQEEYLRYAQDLERKAKEKPDDEALREEAIKVREIAGAYIKFQQLLLSEGKVDFGNQVYLALELLRRHPSVLKRYQKQFKYILVDEFQDTNFAQFQLLKLLAGERKNIACVADDDQCIFRFRGAAYSNIFNFIKEYPSLQKITLIQNYRSTQVILDSAYKLIQHNNPERFEVKSDINKRLISNKDGSCEIEYLYFDTLSGEADNVGRIIQEKVKSGNYKYSDFAILVRANNDAEPFLRSLNMLGIPWRFSGNRGLYSEEEVRLCIVFLRIMSNIQDSLGLYYLATSLIYKLTPLDLSPAMHLARRQNKSLFFVLENLDNEPELSQSVSQEAKGKIEKLILDIKKFLGSSRNLTTGQLLYQFLSDTGYLKGLVREQSLSNEEKILNLSKFFCLVHNFENIAKEDRVVYFIKHLDMLIEAGDDPATSEADIDIDAVSVLTIHKAKGLEFRVVFMVSLVQGRFPWPYRRQPIEAPDELIKDILPSGDFHIQEERRLFYVGMTRSRDELYFTSAYDYGGSRRRRVSQFVLEALGKKEDDFKIKKASGLETIERFAPKAQGLLCPKSAQKPETEVISLSYYQIDDYLTCPLKYKYVHILRVPIMEHHTVLYGKALHDAVQSYFRYKMKNMRIDANQLIDSFLESFKQEGFLDVLHKEKKVNIAIEALKRFFKDEEASGRMPAYIEKDFSFSLGSNRITGRWDRIDINDEECGIIDFKSSEVTKQKDADKRAKESLQLSIYSLAFKHLFGKLPDYVELHFLESGLKGRHKVSEKDLDRTIESIEEAACGIRGSDFSAKPAYLSCAYCAYSQICPNSAASV